MPSNPWDKLDPTSLHEPPRLQRQITIGPENEIPLPVQELAGEYLLPLMPGPSWADLAEDDPEMRLMGPPTAIPHFVDPSWITPKKTRRPTCPPVSINPFLDHTNQFTMLHELGEDDEFMQPPPPPRGASSGAVHPAPSVSWPENDHRSGPSSECTPSALAEPLPPPPSPRTD